MQTMLIDFEFTGLDNSYVTDNEIIQAKVMNLQTGKVCCRNYRSEKRIGAHAHPDLLGRRSPRSGPSRDHTTS